MRIDAGRGDYTVKIIYNQAKATDRSGLNLLGVKNCYFKKLQIDRDQKIITKKAHHHTEFELHIVTEGRQEYEVNGTEYSLGKGDFLLIYPDTTHTSLSSAPHTQKCSITFSLETDASTGCFPGTASPRVSGCIDVIVREAAAKTRISPVLIENCVLEILVTVFRFAGIQTQAPVVLPAESEDENAILAIAKQYIEDNVSAPLSVADVASYCYLSTKQLTRIFDRYEGIAPGEYIKKQRAGAIETLLADQSLSLKQISERMNFSSEYYFNSFFKRYAGMPPGEYRKMLGR